MENLSFLKENKTKNNLQNQDFSDKIIFEKILKKTEENNLPEFYFYKHIKNPEIFWFIFKNFIRKNWDFESEISDEEIKKIVKFWNILNFEDFPENIKKNLRNLEYIFWETNEEIIFDFYETIRFFWEKEEFFNFFSDFFKKNKDLINSEKMKKIFWNFHDLWITSNFLIENNLEISSENIFKYFKTKREIISENYLNYFCKEILDFQEKTWIYFSKDLNEKLLEKSKNFEDWRYGNWFASFSRSISFLINNWREKEIFQNLEIPNSEIFQNFDTKNIYIKEIFNILASLENKNISKNLINYKSFNSGLSTRDKSCKDAELYFYNDANCQIRNKFVRKIWSFIEKNLDKEEGRKTAISTEEISVDWVYYPKWYLFRLKVENGEILWVEPLRMTIFSAWEKVKDFWEVSFWNHFSEFKTNSKLDSIWNLLEEILQKVK